MAEESANKFPSGEIAEEICAKTSGSVPSAKPSPPAEIETKIIAEPSSPRPVPDLEDMPTAVRKPPELSQNSETSTISEIPQPGIKTAESSSTGSTIVKECWGILIREDIKKLKLIRVPDSECVEERCFKHSSYDLRLGSEYVLPHLLDDDTDKQLEISSCAQNGMLTIPGFASAIISTYEWVALPDNVAGRFNLRINHALEGLIAQIGTQVEPGYEGPLFALLHNVSEDPKTFKFKPAHPCRTKDIVQLKTPRLLTE